MGNNSDKILGYPPKVTFIIPAYNVEEFLPQAIDAIQAQTERNWKVIIVDDGSTDKTFEIAEGYASSDPRIKVIRTEGQSGGAYIPRKVGILLSDTEFVAPLDADDKIEPTYLENLINGIRDYSLDANYPVMYKWDGAESLDVISDSAMNMRGIVLHGKRLVKYTLDGWRIHCNGGVIRREVYLKAFASLNEGEVEVKSYLDEYLTRLILFHSRLVGISDEKYYYRVNPQSITHSKDIRAFGLLENNKRLITFVRESYSEDSEEYMLAQRQNFHGIFYAMKILPDAKLNKKDRKRVKRWIEDNHRLIDYKKLKGNVSGKYLLLSRMPYNLANFILRLKERKTR